VSTKGHHIDVSAFLSGEYLWPDIEMAIKIEIGGSPWLRSVAAQERRQQQQYPNDKPLRISYRRLSPIAMGVKAT
jgi:hypothetical protein